MTFAGVRSFFLYQLMFVAMAVFVYAIYYHSLDPQTAGTYTGATIDTSHTAANVWIEHQRTIAMGWWHSATDWRGQAYNALTQPK